MVEHNIREVFSCLCLCLDGKYYLCFPKLPIKCSNYPTIQILSNLFQKFRFIFCELTQVVLEHKSCFCFCFSEWLNQLFWETCANAQMNVTNKMTEQLQMNRGAFISGRCIFLKFRSITESFCVPLKLLDLWTAALNKKWFPVLLEVIPKAESSSASASGKQQVIHL